MSLDPEKRKETEALAHDAISDPDAGFDHRPDWPAILEALTRSIAGSLNLVWGKRMPSNELQLLGFK